MDTSKKEADFATVMMIIKSSGATWQPCNSYEQWKQDKWPAWLKRFQPVRYGFVKSKVK